MREVRGLELSALRAENALLKCYTRKRVKTEAVPEAVADSDDEVVYQFLLENQPQNVSGIHAVTGITRAKIQMALIRLQRENRIVATGLNSARLYHVRLPHLEANRNDLAPEKL
jgi:hypothetical protein